jgi:hypothetical protein
MKRDDKVPETAADDEMLAEYDFSGTEGVRGKYYQRYRQGHTVRVHQQDGSISVRHFKLEDGAVLLDPDVRAYFPDSQAVNRALRALIEILPKASPATVTGEV